jgi:hypothetical protein
LVVVIVMAATFVWVTSSLTVWPTHGPCWPIAVQKTTIHQAKLWCAVLGLNQSVIGAAPYLRPKLFVCADSMSEPPRRPSSLHEMPSESSDWTARQPHARGWLG